MLHEDKMLLRRLYDSGIIERLSKGNLIKLIKTASHTRKRKYPRSHDGRLYGNLPRNYDHCEWERFIKHATHPKARLAFQSEHYGGLRVGEAVVMKLEHINFLKQELIVKTEKTGLIDIVPICDEWFVLLRDWVNEHHEAILNHDGYIFYSDNPTLKRAHISEHWLRRYGGDIRKEAGLDQSYGVAKGNKKQQRRKLYRLTPNHGHRHSFGTNVHEATGDIRITQAALRQTDIRSTSIYTHVSLSKVRDAVAMAFQTAPLLFNNSRHALVNDNCFKRQTPTPLARCDDTMRALAFSKVWQKK